MDKGEEPFRIPLGIPHWGNLEVFYQLGKTITNRGGGTVITNNMMDEAFIIASEELGQT